jgi:hypothetical protein
MPNVEVHIFPSVQHCYMMRWNVEAFSQPTRDFTMARALSILDALRGADARPTLRQAS